VEFTAVWTVVLGLGSVLAASGIYSLATNRLPRPLIDKRAEYNPRRYGAAQLFMGFCSVFLALANMVMSGSPALSLALTFLAIGGASAGAWFLFSAVSARRAP
jgi:hypothetical protein